MWSHDYPKIGGITKTFWDQMGYGGYVPKR